jgi:predicted ATPase
MLPEPDVLKVEAHFEHAFAVAHRQHVKSCELRAAISMARLWRAQGKERQARDLLSAVYSSFTEGFATLDLKPSTSARNCLNVLR